MPPTRPQPGPNENLSGVLGRFHAWTAVQPGRRGMPSAPEGVRKVTYEEALAAQRLRQPLRVALAQSGDMSLDQDLATLLSPKKPAVGSVEVSAVAKQPAAPAAEAVVAASVSVDAAVPVPAAPVRKSPNPTSGKTGTVRRSTVKSAAEAAAAPASKSTTTVAAKARARSRPAAPASFESELIQSLKKPASSARAAGSDNVSHPKAAQAATAARSAASRAKTTATRSAAAPGDRKDQRSISVNLRLSHTEHAQLRTRAAAAKQPMAAFVRDCALRSSAPPTAPVTVRAALPETLWKQRAAGGPAFYDAMQTTPDSMMRTVSDLTSDLFTRLRTLWMGRRIELTA